MGRRYILTIVLSAACALSGAIALAASPHAQSRDARIKALEQRVAELEKRTQPELGNQMLILELRHDRLWWAGEAGNWNLAYYMAGEMGESIQGIIETNGDATALQPQKLSEIMPAMLNAPLKNLMYAIGTRDKAKFAKAYDDLSAACTGCHRVAGNPMLVIGRPKTPMLDDLQYAPESPSQR